MSLSGNFYPAAANISVIPTESIGADGGAILSVDFYAHAVSGLRELLGIPAIVRAGRGPMPNIHTKADLDPYVIGEVENIASHVR